MRELLDKFEVSKEAKEVYRKEKQPQNVCLNIPKFDFFGLEYIFKEIEIRHTRDNEEGQERDTQEEITKDQTHKPTEDHQKDARFYEIIVPEKRQVASISTAATIIPLECKDSLCDGLTHKLVHLPINNEVERKESEYQGTRKEPLVKRWLQQEDKGNCKQITKYISDNDKEKDYNIRPSWSSNANLKFPFAGKSSPKMGTLDIWDTREFHIDNEQENKKDVVTQEQLIAYDFLIFDANSKICQKDTEKINKRDNIPVSLNSEYPSPNNVEYIPYNRKTATCPTRLPLTEKQKIPPNTKSDKIKRGRYEFKKGKEYEDEQRIIMDNEIDSTSTTPLTSTTFEAKGEETQCLTKFNEKLEQIIERDAQEGIIEEERVIEKIINQGNRHEKLSDEIHKQWRMTTKNQTCKSKEEDNVIEKEVELIGPPMPQSLQDHETNFEMDDGGRKQVIGVSGNTFEDTPKGKNLVINRGEREFKGTPVHIVNKEIKQSEPNSKSQCLSLSTTIGEYLGEQKCKHKHQQKIKKDEDLYEETEIIYSNTESREGQHWNISEVGVTSASYKRLIGEYNQAKEWRHSITFTPSKKIEELTLNEECDGEDNFVDETVQMTCKPKVDFE
eukprot:Gb_23327 [translate_table: standard]